MRLIIATTCAGLLGKVCKRTLATSSVCRTVERGENAVPPETEHFDMVIAGGGLVGNTMACAAGTSPFLNELKILVLEPGKGATNKIQSKDKYSNRVSSVSPATVKLFQKIGVWEKMTSVRAKYVRQLQVWDSCSTSRIHYENPDSTLPVSYIVENDVIVQSMTEKILESCSSNVELRTKSSVANYHLPQTPSQKVEIILENGQTITSDLLIGADGVNSQVRNAMKVGLISWKYGQKGLVATLTLSQKWENDIAWQRFAPNGPIALLPLDESAISLVWTTTDEEAQMLLDLDENSFVDKLNEALFSDVKHSDWTNYALFACNRAFETVFGAYCHSIPYASAGSNGQVDSPVIALVEPGSRAAFPFALGHASNYVAPRVALIGDSAHRIHPLAGQGVNLGFGDVSSLMEKLENAVAQGADIGSLLHLKDYESERQRRNVPVMLTCDGLNRLYSTSFSPLVLFRSLGLNAVNRIGPLKVFFDFPQKVGLEVSCSPRTHCNRDVLDWD